jgi:hypothetical protein
MLRELNNNNWENLEEELKEDKEETDRDSQIN